MRFRIAAEFPATHRIRIDTRGTLEPLHAHNWRVSAWLETAPDDGEESGEAVAAARHLVDEWVARHSGKCFNDVPPFDTVNPTAEEVARVLAAKLAEGLPGARVVHVEIGEAAGFSATYWPPGSSPT